MHLQVVGEARSWGRRESTQLSCDDTSTLDTSSRAFFPTQVRGHPGWATNLQVVGAARGWRLTHTRLPCDNTSILVATEDCCQTVDRSHKIHGMRWSVLWCCSTVPDLSEPSTTVFGAGGGDRAWYTFGIFLNHWESTAR